MRLPLKLTPFFLFKIIYIDFTFSFYENHKNKMFYRTTCTVLPKEKQYDFRHKEEQIKRICFIVNRVKLKFRSFKLSETLSHLQWQMYTSV